MVRVGYWFAGVDTCILWHLKRDYCAYDLIKKLLVEKVRLYLLTRTALAALLPYPKAEARILGVTGFNPDLSCGWRKGCIWRSGSGRQWGRY